MRYIEIVKPGGPEVLQLREGERPAPRTGEVLIKVAAAGVNRPDVFQRRGLYPPPPGASAIPGLEVAGEVAALGHQAMKWRIGDRVCALVNGGGYAEFVTAPETQCLPVPAAMKLTAAAALPEACFTVWSNVFERAALKAGESFLVHGGSSGIGTTAIQLAHVRGTRVFATAGSTEKCRACEQLGAEKVVNYHEQDFVEILHAATAGKGVDVVLDMVGGDYIARNIKLAAVDGRIAQIAFLKGPKAEVNFMPLMQKRLTLTGSTLRPRSTRYKQEIAAALDREVWPQIEAGRIRPVVAATFDLAEAEAAHRLMEGGTHIGKIVLTVAGRT
jgi:NADPH2:quinone reductase